MKKIVKFAFAAGLATMAFFFTNTEEASSVIQYPGRWECVDQPHKTSQVGTYESSVADGNYMHIGCRLTTMNTCWAITAGGLELYNGREKGLVDFWNVTLNHH